MQDFSPLSQRLAGALDTQTVLDDLPAELIPRACFGGLDVLSEARRRGELDGLPSVELELL
jgi:hypothetical protein